MEKINNYIDNLKKKIFLMENFIEKRKKSNKKMMKKIYKKESWS